MSANENQFMARVKEGISDRLRESALNNKLDAALLRKHKVAPADRRRRIRRLNLSIPDDNAMWQVLYNTPDRFEVLEDKRTTTPKGDVICTVVYNEIGDDLPIVENIDNYGS